MCTCMHLVHNHVPVCAYRLQGSYSSGVARENVGRAAWFVLCGLCGFCFIWFHHRVTQILEEAVGRGTDGGMPLAHA